LCTSPHLFQLPILAQSHNVEVLNMQNTNIVRCMPSMCHVAMFHVWRNDCDGHMPKVCFHFLELFGLPIQQQLAKE